MKINIPKNSIPPEHAEKLLAAHDGDVALLYIWLGSSGVFDADSAARALCRTEKEICSAYEKLCRLGLGEAPAPAAEVPSAEAKKLPPAEQLPEYQAKDIVSRTRSDSDFGSIVFEAKRLYGRDLSSPELKTLFGIYDYLALPMEVIFVLLNHCFSLFADKYGTGRQPSMRSIEKEAYAWANREILTAEQAEEYTEKAAERRSAEGRIKAALGIAGRALTATEAKYIGSWMDMGYGADTLSIAYDRTVTNTGSLKWSYMDRIVRSWREKELFTPADIEAKDTRSKASVKASGTHRDSVSDDELRRLRAIYDKVKQN